MWFDNLAQGKTWTSLIGDYIACQCGGIRTYVGACPACNAPQYNTDPIELPDENGNTRLVYQAFAGAEARYEDYELLALMEREWRRPSEYAAAHAGIGSGMSPKATLVILYWTYFETRISRLIDIGLNLLPERVGNDLSKRYDNVTRQMRELYRILYGVTYREDLIAVGKESVDGHLVRVQDARNEFIHGKPSAISDALVQAVVREMKEEHDAWISVYNRRIAITLAR